MKQVTLLLCVFLNIPVFSQVGIGTTIPDNSAILDLSTNNKGVLVPRLSTAQMNNGISNPATGLLIFNVTDNVFYYNAGTPSSSNWLPFFVPGEDDTLITNIAWELNGNLSIDETVDFVGTTDTMNLVFKVNNKTWGTIDGYNNFLGVGLSNPSSPITILDTSLTNTANTTDAAIYVVRSVPGGSIARDVAIVGQTTGKGELLSVVNGHAFLGIGLYEGADTLRNLFVYANTINNRNNGVIEDAKGINVAWLDPDLMINPLAEIINGYGIYLDDVKATNGYGIFQVGNDDINYFDGNTGIGVGSATPTSTLEVKGSLSLNIKEVTTSYLVAEDDHTISVIPTAMDTITIPAAVFDNTGRIYVIKRDAEDAGNTIIIRTNNSQPIEGVANVPLDNAYETITLQSTGGRWVIID